MAQKAERTTARKRTQSKENRETFSVYWRANPRISSRIGKNDLQDNSITITKRKIERLKKNKLRYELLEETKKEWTTQISTTDQDESLLVQGVVVEISYNIQAAVDNKHNLVVLLTP
jgi:hypothetical protein